MIKPESSNRFERIEKFSALNKDSNKDKLNIEMDYQGTNN